MRLADCDVGFGGICGVYRGSRVAGAALAVSGCSLTAKAIVQQGYWAGTGTGTVWVVPPVSLTATDSVPGVTSMT
jgi:hypothetical protein